MSKEVRIPHSKIQNTQTITRVMEQEFKDRDLDLHVHEVEHMEDDYKRGERVLKVKNTKYHFIS